MIKRLACLMVPLIATACSAEVAQPPATPPPAAIHAPAEPPTETPAPADVELPETFQTEDFPVTCTAPRFTAAGVFMSDATTGLTWYASDVAYQVGPGCGAVPSPTCPPDVLHAFPTPTAACGWGGTGLRAATTAEVLAIATAIPGCTLPGLMHAVYAWAPNAKASGPLPIETTDGCVDVKAGVSYAGACHLNDFDIAHSTLCVR